MTRGRSGGLIIARPCLVLMRRPPLGAVWRLINVERVWPAWQCYSVPVSHWCCPNSTKRRDDIIRFWLMAQTCHMQYVTRHQSPFFQTFFAAKTFITSNSAKAWSDCQTHNTSNRTVTLSSTVTPNYNTIKREVTEQKAILTLDFSQLSIYANVEGI